MSMLPGDWSGLERRQELAVASGVKDNIVTGKQDYRIPTEVSTAD